MLQAMQKMMRRYGSDMVLIRGNTWYSIRAFLQETRSHSQENTQREISPLGEIRKGLHVYIGPVLPMAEIGDRIVFQERVFEVRRAEPVMVGQETAYCWGLCVEKGGADEWGK